MRRTEPTLDLRSHPFAIATLVITDRARKDPRFVSALEATRADLLSWVEAHREAFLEERAAGLMLSPTLKAAGGLSVMVRAAWERAMPSTLVRGSKLLGDVDLRKLFNVEDLAALRDEVGRAIRALA